MEKTKERPSEPEHIRDVINRWFDVMYEHLRPEGMETEKPHFTVTKKQKG